MYVVNGTGGLVAAIGLLSELDTVIINQRQFLSFLCRKRCDSRATWQLLLLVVLMLIDLVQTVYLCM